MDWAEHAAGGTLVGCPTGRIDENSWEDFLAHLSQAIARAGAAGQAMILDLAAVDYMSSRGLRVLTLAKRDADTRSVALSLARPNDRMREILTISRYDKIFPVAATIDTPAAS